MSDRIEHTKEGSLEQRVVDRYLEISIGATGAVDSFSGKGTQSVTRNSAGNYTIQMEDGFNKLLSFSHSFEGTPSATLSSAPITEIASQDSSAGTITIQTSNAVGVATDLPDTTILRMKMEFRNSTVD